MGAGSATPASVQSAHRARASRVWQGMETGHATALMHEADLPVYGRCGVSCPVPFRAREATIPGRSDRTMSNRPRLSLMTTRRAGASTSPPTYVDPSLPLFPAGLCLRRRLVWVMMCAKSSCSGRIVADTPSALGQARRATGRYRNPWPRILHRLPDSTAATCSDSCRAGSMPNPTASANSIGSDGTAGCSRARRGGAQQVMISRASSTNTPHHAYLNLSWCERQLEVWSLVRKHGHRHGGQRRRRG